MTSYGVQTVQFADGTTWTQQQLVAMATIGTSNSDRLYGGVTTQTIRADSAVFDGKGAPAGSEDYESGGSGRDTFIYNAGYGHLVD